MQHGVDAELWKAAAHQDAWAGRSVQRGVEGKVASSSM